MISRDTVDSFFNEKLPNRNPPGQFLLTKGRISAKGISPGEMLVFSYNGDIVYLALSLSERQENTGPEAREYPYYFCVDIATIISGKGNLKQIENEIKASKNIVKTQGWPTIKDSPEIKKIWNQFKAGRINNEIITLEHVTLDSMLAVHKKMKMLNWWDGEDPFQIVVETIGTQQCKLIEVAIWAYDLKFLADESTGGNMLSVVEIELEDWIRNENSTWGKEAEIAKTKQDWNNIKISHLRNDENRRASIATRSLWAWYGKKFPMRIYPKFVTTKAWTRDHKKWLVETTSEDIISKLNFNIISSKRKLNGVRDFIVKESEGEFNSLSRHPALKPLQNIISIGNETAPKIALFYFGLPYVIFDEYLLRVSRRHRWLSADSYKWSTANKAHIKNAIFNWLMRYDEESKTERLKAFHALINDCGNLYCKKEEPNCAECPLNKVLPAN